jgi:hypothetical protein
MTPTVRSAGTYGSAATETSATVPLPTGWQPGDLCYLGWCLLSAGLTFGPTPAGWSDFVPPLMSQQNANTLQGVLRRVLQAGDSAPVLPFTSGRFCAISVAVTGYHATYPEDTAPARDDGVLANFPDVRIPSITSITNNALLLAFASSRNSTSATPLTWTPPSGMTEVAEVSATVSTLVAMELSSLDLAVPTVTGVKIATPTAATFTGPAPMGVAIVVRDAAAPSFDHQNLLLEDGNHLLQETGHHLLLEA